MITLSSLDGALQLLVLLIAHPALPLPALIILLIAVLLIVVRLVAVAHVALSALLVLMLVLLIALILLHEEDLLSLVSFSNVTASQIAIYAKAMPASVSLYGDETDAATRSLKTHRNPGAFSLFASRKVLPGRFGASGRGVRDRRFPNHGKDALWRPRGAQACLLLPEIS